MPVVSIVVKRAEIFFYFMIFHGKVRSGRAILLIYQALTPNISVLPGRTKKLGEIAISPYCLPFLQ